MTLSTATATASDIHWVRWQLDHLVGWRTSNGGLSRHDAERYVELSGLEAIMLRELEPGVSN